jgi:Outer membrane receptor for Fe3+-dicitrate
MKRILLIAAAFLSLQQAHALVDMKSANYTNTWIDMDVPGTGYDLKVIRTYNSRTLFNGMFGFGWCSDFETSMEILPEGNIKVTECGAGAEVTYSPREVVKKEIDGTINQIITKMKAEKKVGVTDAYLAKLRADLVEDDAARSDFAKKYGVSVPVKEGTKFFANGREVENFVFNKTHYTRTLADGSAQRFDLQGRLTHMYDKNGNFLKFDYDKDVIAKIEDNNNRKLMFKYYPNKKIKSVSGPNGLFADYKFSNLDDLSAVRNAWMKTYTYQYDELHNLTKATWPDKSFVAVKYDTSKDWVIGFTDRDKCTESYKYEFSQNAPKEHFWSTVKKVCGKETIADNKYEFWYKTRGDGQPYLQRVLTVVNGSTTDIVYHEVFGKPMSIRRNADRVAFEYYTDGLVRTKTAGNAKMAFEYEPKIKKVSSVSTTFSDDKGKKTLTKTTQFKYDVKGNLSFAQNSDGQKISMTYDQRGRIASITDQAKKVVKIEYEERYGKPAIVTRPGLGTINVSYKSNGEINKVDSKEGPSVAMQVASTFNNLLDIIAPATAELYL